MYIEGCVEFQRYIIITRNYGRYNIVLLANFELNKSEHVRYPGTAS